MTCLGTVVTIHTIATETLPLACPVADQQYAQPGLLLGNSSKDGLGILSQERTTEQDCRCSTLFRAKILLPPTLMWRYSGLTSLSVTAGVGICDLDTIAHWVVLGLSRQAFSSAEELEGEVSLVSKIVQHLIRREAVLVVVETPQRNEGEALADFNKRQQRERYLAINPNYSFE